jgi:hypothetical protein
MEAQERVTITNRTASQEQEYQGVQTLGDIAQKTPL